MPIVGISGSYGGLNLGDEAILASAIVQLRNALPGVEIVAFSRNAEHTRANQDVDRAINPRTALRDEIIPEVERLDVLLLSGGGILYDTEARTYLREVVIAQARNVPTFAFSVGIGPLKGGEERAAVRDGMNMMTGITVREIGAKRLLEEIGCTRPVTVTADPALLLDPAPFTDDMLRAEGIPADRRLIGLSIRERGAAAPDLDAGGYHGLLAQAADFIVHRYDAQVVFVPMERADLREAHQVIAAMSSAGLAAAFAEAVGEPISDYNQGNVKARIRMTAQYAVAGAHGQLVIGTDQAAEAITGFYTKFGDGGADVLPLAGLNSFTAKFDEHLKSADFFDAAKFADATFKSTKVESAGTNKLTVTGDLTIKDIIKPVVLDVTINAAGEHPMMKVPAVGFDATTTLKRSDFGVGAYAPNVSDEVKIRITTEATGEKPAA